MGNKIKRTFLTLSIILGLFSFMPVGAASIADLQLQINSLLNQIEELQAQIREQNSSDKAWCYTFKSSLWYGKAGKEVSALQRALTREGIYAKKISGTFDAVTASFVTEFQEKYKKEILGPWNLEHGTGYVGKTTVDKLNDLYGCEKDDNKNNFSISYARSKVSDRNQLYAGERGYVYGKNLNQNNIKVILSWKGQKYEIDPYNTHSNQITFNVPSNLDGDYMLYLEMNGVRTSYIL